MTRYVAPQKIGYNFTDADGDAVAVYAVGTSDPPSAIDWNATPHVDFTWNITGTVEVYADGTVIYDDHGTAANHPGAGSTSSSPLVLYVIGHDGKGGLTDAETFTCNFQGASAGDVTAPTFASMNPAVGATGVVESTTITLTFDEAVQQGTGSVTLRNVDLASDIEAFDIVADAGSGPGQVQVVGATVTLYPTSDLPAGTTVSVRWPAGVVKDLSGNSIAAKSDDSVSFDTVPAPTGLVYSDDPSGWRGRAYNYDFGTTGHDLLVDAAGSGDYTTITAAIAAASAGDIIAIKSGVYGESFTVKSGMTLRGYGSDKPILHAQQAVSGFAQCTSADSGVLGSVLGVNGSPVYKKTGILKSAVPVTELLTIMPMENWVPLSNAQDRPVTTDMDFQEDESKFHNPVANGGNYTMSGTNIIGLTDPTIINSSRYTNVQLTAARVRVFGHPNETYLHTITAADVATNSISFGGNRKVDNTGKKRFAIQNVGFAMVAGTWFYVDGGGSTFDLYVYPYNAADIDKITIVARERIATIPNGATNVAFEGLRFFGGTSTDTTIGDGTHIANGNSSTVDGVTIRHCEFSGSWKNNSTLLHYAAVWLCKAQNILIEYNTFSYCLGHAIFPNGTSANQNTCTIRRNVFKRIGSACAKAYQQNKYAFMHNYVEWCGYRSHGNLGNVYIAGVDSVWWGNEFQYCQGYLTSQDNQNPNYCFNWIPCDNKYATGASGDRSNRKIENQGASGICYTLNNSAPPVFTGTAGQGHLAIDPSDSGMTIYVANNVAHGIPTPGDMAGTKGWIKNNLVTHNGHSGSSGGSLDATDFDGSSANDFDTTNQFNTTLANIFTNYATRDWSPVNGSSPLLTMGTYDIESVIDNYFIPTFTGGAAAVPVADFYIDCFGNPIDYNALKMGADQSI